MQFDTRRTCIRCRNRRPDAVLTSALRVVQREDPKTGNTIGVNVRDYFCADQGACEQLIASAKVPTPLSPGHPSLRASEERRCGSCCAEVILEGRRLSDPNALVLCDVCKTSAGVVRLGDA